MRCHNGRDGQAAWLKAPWDWTIIYARNKLQVVQNGPHYMMRVFADTHSPNITSWDLSLQVELLVRMIMASLLPDRGSGSSYLALLVPEWEVTNPGIYNVFF